LTWPGGNGKNKEAQEEGGAMRKLKSKSASFLGMKTAPQVCGKWRGLARKPSLMLGGGAGVMVQKKCKGANYISQETFLLCDNIKGEEEENRGGEGNAGRKEEANFYFLVG